ncbi:MAG: rRNA (pseudouridine1915-N3)-methyltransferase [Thermosediminibacterales bacterium]|nr:rRNA (pseudouridine1915-N3)-methyltransferase [Thermosediminibacterales bacterium]
MNITVIAVGKLNKSYLKNGVADFAKRLRKYCSLNIIEVKEENNKEKDEIIKQKEAERIFKHINPQSLTIALDSCGDSMTSEDFAAFINKQAVFGTSHITFIIGGSVGLSKDIIKSCQKVISFSKMTFPHQLFRLILLEQIYRAFKIIKGEPYHK